jgi:hypothetical protein
LGSLALLVPSRGVKGRALGTTFDAETPSVEIFRPVESVRRGCDVSADRALENVLVVHFERFLRPWKRRRHLRCDLLI